MACKQLPSSPAWFLVTLSLVAVILTGAGSGFGQDIATGKSLATVQTGLSVTATQDLIFGYVMQGVARTMPKNNDDSSGIFDITGYGGAEISIYLILPEYMATDAGSGGGDDRMTIAFNTTDCTLDTVAAGTPAVPGAGAVVDQDPHNLPLIDIGVTDGVCRMYLGGKVTPSVDQKAGNYEGDITCTVAYTGS